MSNRQAAAVKSEFLPPVALDLSPEQHAALVKVLRLMENGALMHVNPGIGLITGGYGFGLTRHFNMSRWRDGFIFKDGSCGTVACIGGTAEMVGNVSFQDVIPPALDRLFFVDYDGRGSMGKITVAQALQALRNYLTTGEPEWKQVLNGPVP